MGIGTQGRICLHCKVLKVIFMCGFKKPKLKQIKEEIK